MEDLIHIDKKWFYLMKDGQRFIIAVDEAEPYRHVQHKSFLTKIMFLCVVTRPLAHRETGASEAVIKEACKGNACVEESMHNMGCLSGVLDPKTPTSHKMEMADEQWKNPVATRWRQITHSRRQRGVQRSS